MRREPISRWPLLWRLYGLPRCSQAVYPSDYFVEACHRLIWPWQPREVRNGSPVHVACLVEVHVGMDVGNGESWTAYR